MCEHWHNQRRNVHSQAIFGLEKTRLALVCNGINVLEGNNLPPAKTNLTAGTRSRLARPFPCPIKIKKNKKGLNTFGREGRKEEGCE